MQLQMQCTDLSSQNWISSLQPVVFAKANTTSEAYHYCRGMIFCRQL